MPDAVNDGNVAGPAAARHLRREAEAKLLAATFVMAGVTEDLGLVGRLTWAQAAAMAHVEFPDQGTRALAIRMVAEAVTA